jgi:hypothetical protein
MKHLKTTLAGLAGGALNLYANGVTGKQVAFSLALSFLGKLAADAHTTAPKPPSE